MTAEYMSYEGCRREVDLLGQQLIDRERAYHGLVRRCNALTGHINEHGLGIDEAGLRAEYEHTFAGALMLRRDVDRFEAFHHKIAALLHEIIRDRDKAADAELLNTMVEAVDSAVKYCAAQVLSASDAREQAANAAALMPSPSTGTDNGLVPLTGARDQGGGS